MGKEELAIIEKIDPFTTNRKRLCSIVSSTFSIKEEELIILESKNNKPYFKDQNISFNLSDSPPLRAFYITNRKQNLGVDIQMVKEKGDYKATLNKAFFKEEEAIIRRVENGFFLIWSLKEALLKSKGGKLFSLSTYSVIPYLSYFSSYTVKNKEGKKGFLSFFPSLNSSPINNTEWELIPFPLNTLV